MEIGDMDLKLYKHIINQHEGDIIQFNRDGETLLYPHLREAIKDCNKVINIVTNGILLWEKRWDIIEATTITVSVIEDDKEQYDTIKRFVDNVANTINTPVFIKYLGNYYNPNYELLGLKTMRRRIHAPGGDWDYDSNNELIPELGICLDFLMKPSVDWQGRMYICNRYDPEGRGIIGDTTKQSLKEIWNSDLRKEWLAQHMLDKRENIPLCSTCKFWGIPRYI